jgi:hypothetical protein
MFIFSSRVQHARVIIIRILYCVKNRNGRHIQLACIPREKEGAEKRIRYVLVRSIYVCVSLAFAVVFGTMLALSFLRIREEEAMKCTEVKGVQGCDPPGCCLPACQNHVR